MPESLKKLPKKECISKMISYFHDKHPEMEDKQIVAVAYKECGASKSDFSDDFCPYKVLSRVRFIRGLESELYTNDFSELPTSIRIAKAVDNNLPKLRSDFPNLEEVEVLKMAYDMARKVLDNSDFETVEEEPIYFEIYIDDPHAFISELRRQENDESIGDDRDFTDDRVDIGAVMKLKGDIIELEAEIAKYRIIIQNTTDSNDRAKYMKESIKKIDELKKLKKQLAKTEEISGQKFDFTDDGNVYSEESKWMKENYIRELEIAREAWLKARDSGDTEKAERAYKLYKEMMEYVTDFTDDAAVSKFFATDRPVSSSNVAEIGYERGKLRIFFKNGGGYEYPVPSSWYTEMLNAPSKGSYVWETLRGKVPGRVIDDPNKMTPGGVGGSIVPYFKIKGARMDPDNMRKSVRKFLKAARRGKAQAGGVPIRRISRPKYKAFKKFLKKGVLKFTPEEGKKPKKTRKFKKIAKKKVKSKESPDLAETTTGQNNAAIRNRIKKLRLALKNARKAGLDKIIIEVMEKRIEALEKTISDFTIFNYYNIVDDFVDDMKHFSGPITRAGDFEYPDGTKTKTFDNLVDVFSNQTHLPTFDSHNENSILGFAYNFTPDKNQKYIFSEGYTFNDIENVAEVPLDSNTKLPVSIRFQDENEGTDNPEQHITDLIHLAISVNRTDQDRCSSLGGNPCYVQFRDKQDFMKNTEHTPEGVSMVDKKEESKKKEPPKDKDEEEEDKDETSDTSKEEMDEEYKSEEKNTKDFKKSKGKKKKTEDFVKISKAEYEATLSKVNDMLEREKERQKQEEERELNSIKEDFVETTQLFRIKDDFLKKATLKQMRLLKSALVQHEERIDPESILFNHGKTSDFKDDLVQLKRNLEKKYAPWKVK